MSFYNWIGGFDAEVLFLQSSSLIDSLKNKKTITTIYDRPTLCIRNLAHQGQIIQ